MVTASADKTAQVWIIDIPTLQQRLLANADCLPPELRQTYLVETEAQAKERYERCQRSFESKQPPVPAPPLPPRK